MGELRFGRVPPPQFSDAARRSGRRRRPRMSYTRSTTRRTSTATSPIRSIARCWWRRRHCSLQVSKSLDRPARRRLARNNGDQAKLLTSRTSLRATASSSDRQRVNTLATSAQFIAVTSIAINRLWWRGAN